MTTTLPPGDRVPQVGNPAPNAAWPAIAGLRLTAPAALLVCVALFLAGMALYDRWLANPVSHDAQAALSSFLDSHGELHEQVALLNLGDLSELESIETGLNVLISRGRGLSKLIESREMEVPLLLPHAERLTAMAERAEDLFSSFAPELQALATAVALLSEQRDAFMAFTDTVSDPEAKYSLKSLYSNLLLFPAGADPRALGRVKSLRQDLKNLQELGELPDSAIITEALVAGDRVISTWPAFKMLVQRLRAISSPSQIAYVEQQLTRWEASIRQRYSRLTMAALFLAFVLVGVSAYYLYRLSSLTERLQRAKETLEHNVETRTAELTEANLSLRREIAERREAERRISRMAMTDSLTGLGNRRLIRYQLSQRMSEVGDESRLLGLFLIDLDHFKSINDGFGHETGDDLLREIGQRLGCLFGDNDTIVRLGDDEFAALVGDLTSDEHIRETAERIQQSVAEPLQGDLSHIELKASIGISIAPLHSMEPDALLRMAGVALEAAKKAGRANFQLYETEMDTLSRDRRELENDLAQAISGGQFELFYQPQIDIRTGQICGAEALIRWFHPERGMVSPADFIPLAEDNGSIIDIGRWALWTAGEQRRAWVAEGLSGFRVAVNVSPLQIQSAGFVETVATMLEATKLDPRLLELEVTENLVISQSDDVPDVLHDLYCLGVELAIDDFGTGYSSLNYLKRFSVHRLKIDRSFITGALREPEDQAIVRTVIRLGHTLGLRVLAEGVEDEKTIDFLAREGCDEVQGFHYAKPMPAADFEQWVRQYSASTVPDRPAIGKASKTDDAPAFEDQPGIEQKPHRSVA